MSENKRIRCGLMFFNSLKVRTLVEFVAYMILGVSLITFIIMFIKTKRKLRRVIIEKDLLEDKYDGVRELKHNFSNFIQTLYGYVTIKDLNGIENMCKKVCEETNLVSNQEFMKIKRIKNPAIVNLIKSKCEYAKCRGIKFNVDCKTSLEDLSIPVYELAKVLGVLIDNAIEAAMSTGDKIVNIDVYESRKMKKKIVLIENSYDKSKIDVKKIYNKGYTSKINNVESHGLGLWSVRKIEEMNGAIHIRTTARKMFCQKIEIDF